MAKFSRDFGSYLGILENAKFFHVTKKSLENQSLQLFHRDNLSEVLFSLLNKNRFKPLSSQLVLFRLSVTKAQRDTAVGTYQNFQS